MKLLSFQSIRIDAPDEDVQEVSTLFMCILEWNICLGVITLQVAGLDAFFIVGKRVMVYVF